MMNEESKSVFETDEERICFKTTFMIHPEVIESSKAHDEVGTRPALSWHQVGTKLELSQKEVGELLMIKEVII
ncbi:MAG: hypothetical protein ACMUIL_10115 [bacterium]